MNSADYDKEIAKLEQDVSALETMQNSKSTTVHVPQKNNTRLYMIYAAIVLGAFVLLYILKPKWILKIVIENRQAMMVVDKTKFVLYWLGISFVGIVVFMAIKYFRHK